MASITGDEWMNRSQRGEVSGIVNCMILPTSECPKCGNHYCYDHLGTHMHRVTDEEQSNEDRKMKV
jgi:hypothetical protein